MFSFVYLFASSFLLPHSPSPPPLKKERNVEGKCHSLPLATVLPTCACPAYERGSKETCYKAQNALVS